MSTDSGGLQHFVIVIFMLARLTDNRKKIQQAYTEQGMIITTLYQNIPPLDIEAYIAKAYHRCKSESPRVCRRVKFLRG